MQRVIQKTFTNLVSHGPSLSLIGTHSFARPPADEFFFEKGHGREGLRERIEFEFTDLLWREHLREQTPDETRLSRSAPARCNLGGR